MDIKAKTIHRGYVIAADGSVYVQLPTANQWGFSIHDDDQSWPGGIGIGEWTAIADDDSRISDDDRERLSWILSEAE